MPHEPLLRELPLIAILRGVIPDRALEVGEALHASGIRAIEVPLNSPDPFDSIARLTANFGVSCICGAGTVLRAADVDRTHRVGGRLIVAPNTDRDVIARALQHKLIAMPGFATATEAFAAIAAGAECLKLFPAASCGPKHLKALKAVLPSHVEVFAVGGVGPDQVEEWASAGASGFAFGSELFKPEYSTDEIAERARRLVSAVRKIVRS